MDILRALKPELDATGKPWRTERGRNLKIFIDGRLALCLPPHGKGSENGARAMMNVRAQIRRAARGDFARC